MAHNERYEELLALWAVGALEEDSREVEAHLAEGCRVCEDLLHELKQSAAVLAAAAPARQPRPDLRGRILKAAQASTPGVRVPSAQAWGTGGRRGVLSGLLAAAAVLLLVFLALENTRVRRARDTDRKEIASLQERLKSADADRGRAEAELARRDLRVRVLESEDIRVLFLQGQDPQPAARAKVFWSEKAKRGIVVAGNLTPLPPDRQYQLWVFDRGKPVDAGVFDVDGQGRTLVESKELASIARAQNFAVTVEPRGGVPQPTGPIVLVGVS